MDLSGKCKELFSIIGAVIGLGYCQNLFGEGSKQGLIGVHKELYSDSQSLDRFKRETGLINSPCTELQNFRLENTLLV